MGLVAVMALLGSLTATVGLAPAGWVVGLGAAVTITGALSLGIRHAGGCLGPADRITLSRAALVCGVAALTASSPNGGARWVMVGLAAAVLVLDNVDGRVARGTGTVSALGARFDMEVDALLILVLSVDVSRDLGVWVLLIGAMRYALLVAQLALPWLRASTPPRYWCKVVAAVQGVVLSVAASRALPAWLAATAVGVALLLLVESFGREVWWLWQRRPAPAHPRRVATSVLTALAIALTWSSLVAPDVGPDLSPRALLQVPVEAVVLIGLAVTLPRRVRSVVAVAAGLTLSLLVLVRGMDVAFELALGRGFQPLTDWTYAGSAMGLLRQSVGRDSARALLAAAGLAAILLVVLLPLAFRRLARRADRRRHVALLALSLLAATWTGSAVLRLQAHPGVPVAAAPATTLAVRHLHQIGASLADGRRFAVSATRDPLASVPSEGLLTGLRGKDVLIVFVESYGRVALDGSASATVRRAVDDGTSALRASGYQARSGWLRSPTFGGLSWLAHSTLQTGLWVDDQRRYDALMRTDRMTLSRAFGRAGWRTVADVPANERPWPEGRSFYRYDTIYGGGDVGYAGPAFSYATMPDQYTLAAFQHLELDRRGRPPVMAEIDLVSSHTPWAPLPRLVSWDALGDGSVFDPMPGQGSSPAVVWQHADGVRRAYAQSIAYSLTTLVSFLRQYDDPNLVVIALGDHQPATVVSGQGASHDVPVTVIARDPAVVDRIDGWGWDSGLRPRSSTPVWPMDAFRDRFLAAYGPTDG